MSEKVSRRTSGLEASIADELQHRRYRSAFFKSLSLLTLAGWFGEAESSRDLLDDSHESEKD